MAFDYDVFLSYSSKDKDIVHALAERLRGDGLRVWLDAWVIEPGDAIGLAIQRGLEKSHVLLMCMSPDYFASEWGTLEHQTLLFRDPTNAQRRFIPVLIADCEPPDVIAQFMRIDWREGAEGEYERLVGVCRRDGEDVMEGDGGGEVLFEEKRVDQAKMVLEGHKNDIWSLVVTPDGETVVSGSLDRTLKVWDLSTGVCRATFEGHSNSVHGVAITPDGQTVVSSSYDRTLKVWDLSTGVCRATFEGHSDFVYNVAVTPNGQTAVSSSGDNTLKVWDLSTGDCRATLEGHSGYVYGVAVTPDGETVVSGSGDNTLKVWDLSTGDCRATLEGHSGYVYGVAVTPDGETVVSGSGDNTLKVWDLSTGDCRATLEGHSGYVYGVAVTPDGETVVSGSLDRTLKVWDLSTGDCRATFEGHSDSVVGVAVTPDGHTAISGSGDNTIRVWDLSEHVTAPTTTQATRYTNAKVVLVGESGVGKTGLALRLCEDRWEPTESTHGMQVSKLELPADAASDIEREVWLWDFAGQPDYRLIHQLYMDETALAVLVFDPQDDDPFEKLGFWEKALETATDHEPAKLLVAGRCDRGGITISDRHFDQYIKQQGIAGFLRTEAKTNTGCNALKEAIAAHIPWQHLPWTATSQLFKKLKDAILKLIEETTPIVRLPELHQRLQLLMPQERFNEEELRAVVGLMQGQGIVRLLDFGDFILLQPEWINRYASVVVRMAREHADEMGVVPAQQVLDGRLDYKEMQRLSEADETILLRAMVQTFLDRSLCLYEETPSGTMLVFPSYFRRDKPDLPQHPNVFVTYGFSGPLDEIYATLVVRLSYSEGFQLDQLWKDAADFKTFGGKRAGLAIEKKSEGSAELVAYFDPGVQVDTQVAFIKYIHEHLLARSQSREEVTRVRTYVCPHCDTPLGHDMIKKRLEREKTDILCGVCEERMDLLDLIEEKFASDEAQQRVRELDEQAQINLDNESRELILVGHATAIAAEAGQIFRPVAWADWGIDGEIEFKNNKGQASGQRVYLQLKSGDSYLYKRQRDDQEVFTIKNRRHVEYWTSQAYPVMLVVRTSDGRIRWMDVSDYLRRHGPDIKQVVFAGEPFTAPNVARLRDKILPAPGS